MGKLWIVVADEARARILQWQEETHALEPVDELTDAAAHAHEADLRRDAKGGYYGKGEQLMAHTTDPRTEHLEHETELFARRVAQRLAEEQQAGHFERLRIAAAPRFLGRLRQAMTPQVSERIEGELDKDLVNLPPRELADHLFPADRGGALH